jgi:lambda repressor-like predicted transcriptional regulator
VRQQDPDDPDMWAAAKAAVRKQFLGAMFIVKSDSKRYGMLTATLQNDFISSHNRYPQIINVAYDMLVNYVNPNRNRTLQTNHFL